MLYKIKYKLILLIIIIFITAAPVFSKEAIVFLGGIFGKKPVMKKIEKYFIDNYGYDTYSFQYIARKSIDVTYENFLNELEKIDFNKYEKVHFFCHIFGSRIFLKYMEENEIKNLGNVIFDRGPLQEDLGKAIYDVDGEDKLIFFGGRNLLDFTFMNDYKMSEYLKNHKIGIIIETKPISLCYVYKEGIIKRDPSFLPDDIMEKYDDYFYVPLNHRQMYTKLIVIADEINSFLQKDNFGEEVNREQKDYLADF